MGKLDGRVAVVTGAAMGNGEGIARVMAGHGAFVALWDISEKVVETAKSIQEAGHQAEAFTVDVTKMADCQEATDALIAKKGKVDILCANAGVVRLVSFLEMSDEDRDFQFDVNIKGVWNCAKAVLPNMVANRYGRVVVMSSVTGPIVVDEGEAAYATSKGAVWGLTKSLAREMAAYSITVNAICPGYVRTPMVEAVARQNTPDNPEETFNQIAAGVPLGRLATLEEIGDLAAFLGSDESRYITGTQVVIDGGSTLPETTMKVV